jgi:DNA repair exonuclease SbcCD ATPase subunit
MIQFSKLFYRNFLSTGNAGTTILLDKSPTTLIQGQSGAGKSTLIDALCFGLYGKPFRNINKPQLVNSINQKQCEVIVEFIVNARHYKIERGIKPAKFDIFCDGKLLSQDAAVKDYQNVLEQQILMMSFKTFTQIVILGSTSYTPFMQLAAAARREVIEDILDIGVFSTMNQLLKQQIIDTKEELTRVDSEIKTLKEKAEGLKRLIEVVSTKQQDEVVEINEKIKEITTTIKTHEVQVEEKVGENKELSDKTKKLKELFDASNKLAESVAITEAKHNELQHDCDFFDSNDSCPTCNQGISGEHKMKMINDLNVSLESNQEKLENFKTMRARIKSRIDEMQVHMDKMVENNSRIESLTTSISLLQTQEMGLLDKLSRIQEQSHTNINVPKSELKDVARSVLSLVDLKKELSDKRQLQEGASVLLRDTGIKTAIIREYLPIINKLINKYLTELELFIEFNLDEQFNEVIKSRHRDEFTYDSFSAGEALRIDLAMLFAWRHIAKIKNSASCNLLILDEILVGRLDSTNSDIVINMINQLAHDGNNIFAISHGDHLQDRFRSVIRFEKQGDYSVMATTA